MLIEFINPDSNFNSLRGITFHFDSYSTTSLLVISQFTALLWKLTCTEVHIQVKKCLENWNEPLQMICLIGLTGHGIIILNSFLCCKFPILCLFTLCLGTNDAFVTIGLGKETFQTSVKEKASGVTEWHEKCELYVALFILLILLFILWNTCTYAPLLCFLQTYTKARE